MKKTFIILSLVIGTSVYANQDCRISVYPNKKYLPESFVKALEDKKYQITSKKDSAISLELAQVLPNFVSGKFDVTHKATGFRKRYAFAREIGGPDPLREVYEQKLSNARSVSEYEAIKEEILNTTFNDIPDGQLSVSLPECSDFYGKEKLN